MTRHEAATLVLGPGVTAVRAAVESLGSGLDYSDWVQAGIDAAIAQASDSERDQLQADLLAHRGWLVTECEAGLVEATEVAVRECTPGDLESLRDALLPLAVTADCPEVCGVIRRRGLTDDSAGGHDGLIACWQGRRLVVTRHADGGALTIVESR